jgi:hypothetical protein
MVENNCELEKCEGKVKKKIMKMEISNFNLFLK